jgi:ankyrin repeat protein
MDPVEFLFDLFPDSNPGELFPLHAAVERGSLEEVREQLKRGEIFVDDHRTSDNRTPFAIACRAKNIK